VEGAKDQRSAGRLRRGEKQYRHPIKCEKRSFERKNPVTKIVHLSITKGRESYPKKNES